MASLSGLIQHLFLKFSGIGYCTKIDQAAPNPSDFLPRLLSLGRRLSSIQERRARASGMNIIERRGVSWIRPCYGYTNFLGRENVMSGIMSDDQQAQAQQQRQATTREEVEQKISKCPYMIHASGAVLKEQGLIRRVPPPLTCLNAISHLSGV